MFDKILVPCLSILQFDEILKSIIRGEEFTKETFTERLNKSRIDAPISSEAADYIFELLDTTKDGILRDQDFKEIQSLIRMGSRLSSSGEKTKQNVASAKGPFTHSD